MLGATMIKLPETWLKGLGSTNIAIFLFSSLALSFSGSGTARNSAACTAVTLAALRFWTMEVLVTLGGRKVLTLRFTPRDALPGLHVPLVDAADWCCVIVLGSNMASHITRDKVETRQSFLPTQFPSAAKDCSGVDRTT